MNMPAENTDSLEATDKEQKGVVCFPAGELLVKEGEASRKMFIIRSGRARVFRKYLGQHVTLAILGEGELFGEMSFFDGEPRSASVEALTELQALIIDGSKGQKQISDLPDWVHSIFRTVAARFRRLDHQVTMLQSVYEFQKKSFKTDNCAKTIYSEILRFSKTIDLLCQQQAEKSESLSHEEIISQAEGLLGNRYLSFRIFWNLLKEHEFIPNEKAKQGEANINREKLKEFEQYIEAGIGEERFPIISHSALSILRRLVSLIQEPELHGEKEKVIPMKELKLHGVFGKDDAILELTRNSILCLNDNDLVFMPRNIVNIYTWQTIVKTFDYTTICVD